MNKFCKECGNKLENSAKFCSGCGSKIDIDFSNDKISTDINVNFRNETTEKIINDVSEGVQKAKNKTFSIFGAFYNFLPKIIIFLIIWIILNLIYHIVENAIDEAAEKERIEVVQKEHQKNRMESDAKYWNDGQGYEFVNNSGHSLRLKVENYEADHAEVDGEVFKRLDVSYDEGDIFSGTVLIVKFASSRKQDGTLKLYYRKYFAENYEIEKIIVPMRMIHGTNPYNAVYHNQVLDFEKQVH